MAPRPTNADIAPDASPESQDSLPAQALSTNVVVLAEDATLLELLRHALEGRQRIWRADDAMHAADLLLAAHSGVLFVDVALTGDDTPELVDKLHAQFPDLPIVVAGRRDDEHKLGQRISRGIVFRFLHKPLSAERARNFIDAAVRRADDQKLPDTNRTEFNAVAAARSIRLPRLRIEPAFIGRLLRGLALLFVAGVALWATSKVVGLRPWEQVGSPSIPVQPAPVDSPPVAAPVEPAASDLALLLGAAEMAESQGRLAEPPGQNAIELYRAVLLRDPGNADARDGLSRAAEELLVQVEQSLLAEDLVAAAAALDAARSADPTNPRLGLYSAQILRERGSDPAAVSPAQSAAAADLALLEQVNRLLALADTRLQQNRLAGGPDDAKAYVLAARDLQPEDPGVQQVLSALSDRMLLAAGEAIRSGDMVTAAGWLDHADALAVDRRSVARLRAELESIRVATVQEDKSRLMALANQRIAQGQLLQPEADSARHYIDLLQAADPLYEGLAETEALLAAGLLEQARKLASESRLAASGEVLSAAQAAGARGADVAALREQLAATRARTEAANEVLPEKELRRRAHRPPVYPTRAEQRGIAGWVEVEFTVAADGTTRDAIVTGSDPTGVFEQAVLDAVEGWRYEPRIVGGGPVDQRVQTRVRFELAAD